MNNFDPYNVLLAIATDIAVLLMTGSRDTFMNSLHILLLWCPFFFFKRYLGFSRKYSFVRITLQSFGLLPLQKETENVMF